MLPHDGSRAGPIPPGHIPFWYVSGLKADDPPETILAFDEEWSHDGEGVMAVSVGCNTSWQRDIVGLHKALDEQMTALARTGRDVKLVRPPWSRWPERPQYPPVPWDRRKAVPALVIGAAALVVLLVAAFLFPPWKRRRA